MLAGALTLGRMGSALGDRCGPPDNTVNIDGGCLFVTNSDANATAEVRYGTLHLSSGVAVIDRLLIKPGTGLVEILVDSLLAARRPYGDALLWPEKAEPLLITPAPSVAHTARAVWVLAGAQAIQPSGQVQEALEQAVAWLVEQRDLHNAYEATERPVNGVLELVHIPA